MNKSSPSLKPGLSIKPDRNPALLIKLLTIVNCHYFEGNIRVDIRWASPEGTVNLQPRQDSYQLSDIKNERLQFDTACQLIKSGKASAAQPLLEPLADLGHRDSQLLLIHLLLPDSLQRLRLCRQYNLGLSGNQAVPAACFYPQKNLIVVHPFLLDKPAPQYVIKYLIYHECCHQIIGDNSCSQQTHSPHFMMLEYNAPRREKALYWLEREGFPTIRLTDPDSKPLALVDN